MPSCNTYLEVEKSLESTLKRKNIKIDLLAFEKEAADYFKRVKLPKLYFILIDEVKATEESHIRTLSLELKISREAAINYIKSINKVE